MLGHSFRGIAGIAWDRFNSLDNGFLLLVVMQVVWLSTQMDRTGIMGDLVLAVHARISRKSAMAALPALIGSLPMPAGAIFSAPMVDRCDDEGNIDPQRKAQINHWFRHLWEYWWPLYPGVLVAMEITGLEVWEFALLQFPMSLIHGVAGYIFFLRKLQSPSVGREVKTQQPDLLPLMVPIILVVFIYAMVWVFFPSIAQFSKYLPMSLGILLSILYLQFKRPLSHKIWRDILLDTRTISLGLLVAIIRIYGAFIEHDLPDGTPLVVVMRQELESWGIPVVLMIMVIPLISGITTGIAVGFVGASLPIAVNLLGDSPAMSSLMATTLLAYTFGYMGLMLSPVHLCLLVGCEHFNTKISGCLVGLLRPASLVLLGGIVIYISIIFIF